jgi:hypothetical protein
MLRFLSRGIDPHCRRPVAWLAAGIEGLDDEHAAATAGARLGACAAAGFPCRLSLSCSAPVLKPSLARFGRNLNLDFSRIFFYISIGFEVIASKEGID